MKIGLLADTHGYLDQSIFKHFAACDEIWHAGDFGTLELVNELSAFKPLRGVYGNIDDQHIRALYPEDLRFTCESVDVWMTHIGGYPGKYAPRIRQQLYAAPPKLFISGHSHILKVMYDKKINCLHLNPGAAGKQGWHKVRTLMRLEINGTEIKNLEVIELLGRG
ncbi:metallophosphoesterase family protein [Olivibacter ginsenosidimutans]|uniref:Phosphoesterase n=1 Tax=Olivibacter ginsenosidimutans TaxID=1176537 RepID=A0ABP9B1E9_9SPHI